MDIQKLDQTYIAGTYARFPVTIVKGKGSSGTRTARSTSTCPLASPSISSA